MNAPYKPRLVEKFADKFGVDPAKLLETLKATAFRQRGGEPVTNEQMMALLVVADQHGLNPFTKEIFAYNDKGAIVPVVSVDGWIRITNEHPQFDGMEFRFADEFSNPGKGGKDAYIWIECVIYRKDRSRPTIIREYLDETYQGPRGEKQIAGPWQSHTKRMLRHKALIQCSRVAFGFAGIHDEDEARHIVERDMGAADEVPQPKRKSEHAAPRAIEHADQDGVIDWSSARQEREPEPVEHRREQEQPRARRAAPRPMPEGETVSDELIPVSESVINMLKSKMEDAGLGESDMKKRLGYDLDGVHKGNYQAVLDWIADPLGE